MTGTTTTNAIVISRRGQALVAEIDNPPVNALSHAVRAGLLAAIDELEADASLTVLVIAARGRLFSAGADVTEFGSEIRDPQLGEIIARLDRARKPVVAAIAGAALGGGLEVALACNVRVAGHGATFALPEVKLGMLPGAGGIVRLPRLIGIATALSMIAEGREIDAARAHRMGLVDRLAEDDVIDEAIHFAEDMPAEQLVLRRASILPFPEFDEDAQAKAGAVLAKKYRDRIAPQKAVELIAMAAVTPFDEAARREYEACRALAYSPQSRALRHVFAAERAAARPAAIPTGTSPRKVEKVGVLGTGAMGRGIAAAVLEAGLPVVMVGRSETSLDKARQAIAKTQESRLKRGHIDEAELAARMERLTTTCRLDQVSDADLVVETIAEDMATKRAIIAAVDAVLGDRSILVTNTSFLDVEALAAASTRPQNFAGMHFFNPANLMKLVENVRTAEAAPDVLATLMAFAKRLGKTAVLVGPSDGFVANRMLSKRTREALFLIEDGASPAQVDRVLAGFGFPVGPFTLADMAGLDVMAATRTARAASMSERERGADIAEQLVAVGRLGRKSGAGYYAYGEDGKPTNDPAVYDLLAAHRQRRGIAAREITDEEVLDRCLLALVNEGAKLIEEGAVERAGDIDVIWTAGLGFPAHLGGPMFWASERGLKEVRDALAHYARVVGDQYFAPAGLIAHLAERGERFE